MTKIINREKLIELDMLYTVFIQNECNYQYEPHHFPDMLMAKIYAIGCDYYGCTFSLKDNSTDEFIFEDLTQDEIIMYEM